MIARYWTMRGYKVPRVWGWDCHGLPIENQAEQLMGIEDKNEIEKSIGIDVFNDKCFEIVSSNNDAWKEYVEQMARWVDYDGAYKTMNTSFMESVMWAFKTCYDKGLFSIFYKAFLTRFSSDYGIEQVVDTRTSDVTRACFLSYDPDAYLNSEAEAVDLSAFVDTANTLTFAPQSAKPQQPARTPSDPVSQTAIENIKQILAGAKATAKAKPEAFVPQQLAEIIDELKSYIEQSGAMVRQIESIQYGKKIKTLVGAKQAETNVFYGRRGFSVVISPRTGTDAEANQLVADLIQSFFDTHT